MLAGVLTHHEGALRASLQAEYGLRLLRGGRTEPHRTPRELGDLIEYLPPGCALGREMGGEAALSNEALMAREIEFTLRQVSFAENGSKGTRPQRLPLPEAAADKRAEAAEMDAKLRAHTARAARRGR